jgi:hypothetical protein
MKRFKVVGLCLVAVFALCAVLVASASAASPEYFTCTKAPVKNTGNYSGKACSEAEKVAGTGKYERTAWNAGKKTSFKGKNEGNPHNNIVNPFGKNKVVGEPGQIEGTTTCEKEKVAGNVTGPKETKWKTEYKKCSALETKCNTAGQKEGTIVTEELESTLVWLDSGKTKAGIKAKREQAKPITCHSRQALRDRGCGTGQPELPIWQEVRNRLGSRRRLESVGTEGDTPVGETRATSGRYPTQKKGEDLCGSSPLLWRCPQPCSRLRHLRATAPGMSAAISVG